MKRALPLVLAGLAVSTLLGCDAGREPLRKAAEAEAAGDLAGAATLYRAVCDKGSALCPTAARQADRIALVEARKALDEGAYKKARAALDAALASKDAGVKRAAEGMGKLPELEQGLSWEDAAASPEEYGALGKMEAVADAGVSASVRAREWLAKHRPRLLLARVRAACAPGGKGSCVEAGQELGRRHPGSPEQIEAQGLVDAAYARIFPLLEQAEKLVGQRAMLTDKQDYIEECIEAGGEPERDACTRKASTEPMPTVAFLTGVWQKKLDEIHDPSFVRRLEVRWERAAKDGLHELDPWPKPAGARRGPD